MYPRSIAIVYLLLFSVCPAAAQVVRGTILDAETGEPLVGATAFISAVQSGAAADLNGMYRIELDRPGTYRIVYSYVGYQSEARTATVGMDSITVNLSLRPTAVEAPPVTVTAKAQASDILSTPQAVSVLEGRALIENRGTTALDALDETAGVRLVRTGVGVAKPMIRGLTSQRVLVIQNGVRQEGQQWGDEHGPELDAFDVDRIEVVKGPASLLYGSDALGGVIQVTSGDLFAYNQPFTGMLALQGMSNTMLGATHAELGGQSGTIAYEGGLSWKRAGSYETPNGRVPNTGMEELNGSARFGWQRGKTSLIGGYQHFGTRLGFFEPEEEHHEEEPGHVEEPAPELGRFEIGEPYQQVQHDRLRLEATLPLRGNRLEIVSSVQRNRRKEFGHHEHEDAGSPEPAVASMLQADEEGAGLFLRLTTLTTDARFHHRPLGRIFGTVGLSGFYQVNETLGEESLVPGAQTLNGAAYLYEELVLPKLTLSGGLRYDARQLDVDANEDLGVVQQTRDYQALSGAVGMAWQPQSGLSLALNAGRAWRAPVLIELFARGVHEGTIRFEQGNPALEPEQSLSLDGIVRWLMPHAYLEAAGFVNTIDGFIFTRPTGELDPESGYFVYAYGQAKARLWGAEVSADLHPHPLDWVHLRLSGDVTLTENLETGDPLPFSPAPRLRGLVELDRQAAGPFRDVSLQFGPTIVFDQNRVAPLETPTDGYTLWEAGISTRLDLPNGSVLSSLRVENLFDTAYVDHLSRFKPYGVLNPGRNIVLELQFRLP